MDKNRALLYAFWASSCSWRTRAALWAKRVPCEERSVDILKGQHATEDYRAINPGQKVPTLVIDGETIVESMAIIQYLEETRPEPSLVPATPLLRARMREIVEVVVSDIQPLQGPTLRAFFGNEEEYVKFKTHHITRGLATLEALLSRTAGRYCIGDQLTIADLCLVPQLHSVTKVHKVPVGAESYPTVARLFASLLKEDVFINTHPRRVKDVILPQ